MDDAPTRSRIGLIAGALVVAVLIALGVGLWTGGGSSVTPLRIATGGAGGTYLPLGTGMAEAFNRALAGRVRAEALETSGSSDNVARLERHEVELAIVQNDTEVGRDVRAIAPLYPEVLHVVVRRDAGIRRLADLRGHRTAAGPEGSGTHLLTARILEHFELTDIEQALVHCSTTEAVERFEASDVDAVVVVSGLKSSAVTRLLDGEGTLLSLGNPAQVGSALDGLRVSHPFLSRAVIPARTYGDEPPEPVGSVAVEAVLVTRVDVDARLVHDLTATLFENRVALMKSHRAAAHLSEQFDPSALQAPLHDGAEWYYRRDAPPFYVEYAELMSLVFTLALALGSGLLAVRRWVRQTKKDRIDVYYLDIHTIMQRWEQGEIDAAAAATALEDLRSRAFSELVDERLAADQSFTIFQDYLTTELGKLERLTA